MDLVVLLVPNPGMVMQWIFSVGKESILNVFKHTKSARVLSKPPDKPNITFSVLVDLNLCANPRDCRFKISSHLLVRSSLLLGTNGYGFTVVGKTNPLFLSPILVRIRKIYPCFTVVFLPVIHTSFYINGCNNHCIIILNDHSSIFCNHTVSRENKICRTLS